jgi:N-acetylmuramoyl-L-alanine amidase
MEIIKKLIKYNFTPNANTPVYIVVHDTGNYSVGANAESHYQYFNSADRQSSAHFFVDSTQIIQTVEIKDKSWSCGDGRNLYGINNSNSIGIEICINSDGNYDLAVANTIELVSYLAIQYKIPLEKIVRHYDASRKNCPQTMNNNGNWSRWINFKQKVALMIQQKTIPQYKYDAVTFLSQNGFINNPHEPLEIITFGTLGYTFNNYLTKTPNIDPINWLTANGFIKSWHDKNEQLTVRLFAYVMANRFKEVITTTPIEYLMQKGFITQTRNDAELVEFWLIGAMLKNYIVKGGKI